MDSYDSQPSPGRGRESDVYRRRSPGKTLFADRAKLITVTDTRGDKKVFLKTAAVVVPHAAARDRLP